MGPVGMGLGGTRGRGGSRAHADHVLLQQPSHQQGHSPLQQQQHRGLGVGRADAGIGVGDGASTRGGMPGAGGAGSSGERGGTLSQDFAGLDLGVGGGVGVATPLSAPGSRSNSFGGASVGAGSGAGFEACKDDLLGDFPCVRLRGLATDTSVKDILDFFVGLGPVLDIVLEVSVACELGLWRGHLVVLCTFRGTLISQAYCNPVCLLVYVSRNNKCCH